MFSFSYNEQPLPYNTNNYLFEGKITTHHTFNNSAKRRKLILLQIHQMNHDFGWPFKITIPLSIYAFLTHLIANSLIAEHHLKSKQHKLKVKKCREIKKTNSNLFKKPLFSWVSLFFSVSSGNSKIL